MDDKAMVFEAEMVDGVLKVKPIIESFVDEKTGERSKTVHLPSFELMAKAKLDYGKRNIQQI